MTDLEKYIEHKKKLKSVMVENPEIFGDKEDVELAIDLLKMKIEDAEAFSNTLKKQFTGSNAK